MNAEPSITINGTLLSEAQAVTLRVALEFFAMDLSATGLGNDAHGIRMTNGYLRSADEIRNLMFQQRTKP